MKRIIQICSSTKGRNLKVLLPKVCNYRCSYCFQKKEEGPYDPHFFTPNKLKIMDSIIQRFSIDRIALIGGEPTLFDLSPLIKYSWSHHIKEYFITTNFSQSNDYFLKMLRSANEASTSLKLCCSLHEEFVDFKQFVQKVNNLFDKGLNHVAVEFVVAKNNLDCCFQIIDYIKRHLHKDIFFLIDCDLFDEEIKKYYETHSISHRIHAKGINYSVEYEDGEQKLFPRQELRLQAIQGTKYCITDLVLSETNNLSSCYRELGPTDGLLTACDWLHDEEKFKCPQTYCRFCDSPHIFFKKEDFKQYLIRHYNI